MPVAYIRCGISSGMNNRYKLKGGKCAQERRIEHIRYLAVLVLHANLRLLGVGVVGMYGVGMRVQLQQKGIGHHRPAKKQQQQQGDMS